RRRLCRRRWPHARARRARPAPACARVPPGCAGRTRRGSGSPQLAAHPFEQLSAHVGSLGALFVPKVVLLGRNDAEVVHLLGTVGGLVGPFFLAGGQALERKQASAPVLLLAADRRLATFGRRLLAAHGLLDLGGLLLADLLARALARRV